MRARLMVALALMVAPLAASANDMVQLVGHGGPVKGIAVAEDGRVLTASFDYAVGVWEGDTARWLDGHRAAVNAVVALGPDRVATAGDDFDVRIWHLPEGTAEVLSGHKGKVIALARDAEGKWLASAGWDGQIGLWPLAGDRPARMLSGHTGAVNDVLFGADGRLYSASADGTVRVWDPDSGATLTVLISHGFGVNTLAMGPGDAWLGYGAVDGGTRIVTPDTGDEIRDFTLERRPILAMAASPDGSRLAVGDGEGYIMVLDTLDWRIEHDFRAAARGPVWALAWSRGGDLLYAAGISDTVFGWPVHGLGRAAPVLGAGERSFLRAPEGMSNGERQFARKCSVCHTLNADRARRAGPPLAGLFGRRAGSVPGYAYSPAMHDSSLVWTRDTINDLFEIGPDRYVPGTKMPMQRIASPRDRADLLDYLERATRN